MDDSAGMLSQIAAYQPALLAVIILCLAVLVQSFFAGVIGLGKSDEVPGTPLKGTHGDFSFRTLRTYANSTENLPAFATVVFVAIIVGASPIWVNWLAGIHVAIRFLYWAVYYAGVGEVLRGPRSMTYVAGWAVNLVLAVVAAAALLN